MLDSALEPSYDSSKNLLLMPWILKLMVDMVDDSTSLIKPNYEFSLTFDFSDTGEEIGNATEGDRLVLLQAPEHR